MSRLSCLSRLSHFTSFGDAKRASLLFALCGMLLSACHVGPAISAQEVQQPLSVTAHTHRPAIAYQDCADRSGSYPQVLLRQSKDRVATWLDGAVQDNAGAIWFVYNYVDDNPLLPSAVPVSFTVNPTPAYPPLHLPAKPQSTGDPYRDGQNMAQWRSDTQTVITTYNHAVQSVNNTLGTLRQQVHVQAQTVQNLQPPVEHIDTSVLGCLYTAATRFATWPGQKFLTVTSDLLNNTDQDLTRAMNLRGFVIWITYLFCSPAPACDAVKTAWTSALLADGAASVAFFDPATSNTLPAPWDVLGAR